VTLFIRNLFRVRLSYLLVICRLSSSFVIANVISTMHGAASYKVQMKFTVRERNSRRHFPFSENKLSSYGTHVKHRDFTIVGMALFLPCWHYHRDRAGHVSRMRARNPYELLNLLLFRIRKKTAKSARILF
jgi:hypothetical protein